MKWYLLIAALCIGFYELGRSHAPVKVITKEKEVIRYVDREPAKIPIRPNADRTRLLKLMYAGKL